MTNKQALDLRKQAVMGSASHHLHAVQEDAMATDSNSVEDECSKLSLASSSNESDHPSAAVRHKVELGSWEAYWDSRQAVEVPGRSARAPCCSSAQQQRGPPKPCMMGLGSVWTCLVALSWSPSLEAV